MTEKGITKQLINWTPVDRRKRGQRKYTRTLNQGIEGNKPFSSIDYWNKKVILNIFSFLKIVNYSTLNIYSLHLRNMLVLW